ncbi:MAG: sulfotransferase domain-containing protein [Microscillaceae bacterium]|jgi:hypothetical protein|nr:sulfotransferase domain-containing protein [Microscillaceae bacterium]
MDKTIYGYFGHPKCASKWMSGIALGVGNAMGFKIYQGHYALKKIEPKRDIEDAGIDFIISQNTNYEKVAPLTNYKGVHLFRDPRDMLVSGYFSYKYSHSHLQQKTFLKLYNLISDLKDKDIDEGLLMVLDFDEYDFNFLKTWNYDDPNILNVRLEDLTQNTYENLAKIFDFLGLLAKENKYSSFSYYLFYLLGLYNRVIRKLKMPYLVIKQKKLPSRYLKKINDQLSFEKLSGGRKTGNENIKSHYRKGQAGDWKNYFKEEHKIIFKEKYGDLLIKLGYEKDLHW